MSKMVKNTISDTRSNATYIGFDIEKTAITTRAWQSIFRNKPCRTLSHLTDAICRNHFRGSRKLRKWKKAAKFIWVEFTSNGQIGLCVLRSPENLRISAAKNCCRVFLKRPAAWRLEIPGRLELTMRSLSQNLNRFFPIPLVYERRRPFGRLLVVAKVAGVW